MQAFAVSQEVLSVVPLFFFLFTCNLSILCLPGSSISSIDFAVPFAVDFDIFSCASFSFSGRSFSSFAIISLCRSSLTFTRSLMSWRLGHDTPCSCLDQLAIHLVCLLQNICLPSHPEASVGSYLGFLHLLFHPLGNVLDSQIWEESSKYPLGFSDKFQTSLCSFRVLEQLWHPMLGDCWQWTEDCSLGHLFQPVTERAALTDFSSQEVRRG